MIDTRPLARELHHYILNHREMYGLPRKFNIGFDGGGRVAVLEETNDIGFAAVRVGEGKPVPAGVYFRMALGGITGVRVHTLVDNCPRMTPRDGQTLMLGNAAKTRAGTAPARFSVPDLLHLDSPCRRPKTHGAT